jgi:hypothetical protein
MIGLSRGLSLLVAAVYLAIVGLFGSHRALTERLGATVFTAFVLCFPLACIWFGDELGEYVGLLPGPAISKRSPGWLVKVCGWVLLFLPTILVAFMF